MTNRTKPPGPADIRGKLPPFATTLFGLAGEIADFANEQTENLSFGEHADLMEYEAKLLAYGNLLSTFNRDAFLEEEIAEASDFLQYIRQRISPPAIAEQGDADRGGSQ